MSSNLDVAPLSKDELNKFLDSDVQELIDDLREMRTRAKTEEKNFPYFSFLNKMVKFSVIAANVFEKEFRELKRREEDKELDGSIDSISNYGEDDSGDDDIELLSQRATYELMTLTKGKGYMCDKKYVTSSNIKIIEPVARIEKTGVAA